ncbi:hypothetical protein K1719_002213 [Acacia pycnantha]|nr:hypothetical protein K1719_002213 [Acacia pycnantha]
MNFPPSHHYLTDASTPSSWPSYSEIPRRGEENSRIPAQVSGSFNVQNEEKLRGEMTRGARHCLLPLSSSDTFSGEEGTISSCPENPSGRILTLSLAYTPSSKDLPIAWVDQNVQPCYVSHVNGHFLWDVPGSNMYDPNCEYDTPEWFDDYGSSQPVSTRRSTRRWQPLSLPTRLSKDMSLVKLMIETGYLDLVWKYFPDVVPSSSPKPATQPPVVAQPIPYIAMLNPYEQDFPPLERKYNEHTRVSPRPYVVPNTIDSQGRYQSSAAEEISPPKLPPQPKPRFVHQPRPRPPYFTLPYSTYDPGIHSEAEIANISRIAIVQPNEEENMDQTFFEHPYDLPPRQYQNYKPSSSPWFTFDDIPYSDWGHCLHEFGAWINLHITGQQIPLKQVLYEFVSIFTSTLRDWFQNLSEYQKLQAVQVQDAGTFFGVIHKDFIGDYNIIEKREKQ